MKNKAQANIFASYASPAIFKISIIYTNGIIEYNNNLFTVYGPRDVFSKDGKFKQPPIIFKKKIILVKNVFSSLHQLASYSRKEIKGEMVAITGSVGKTSVKEALSFILNDKNKIQSTTGNFNNLIGMPINLANFHNEIDISILEVGMNKKGEIKKLSNICKPDIGLITKISNAHIGNFNSLKDIALAKSEIFFGMNNLGRQHIRGHVI